MKHHRVAYKPLSQNSPSLDMTKIISYRRATFSSVPYCAYR